MWQPPNDEPHLRGYLFSLIPLSLQLAVVFSLASLGGTSMRNCSNRGKVIITVQMGPWEKKHPERTVLGYKRTLFGF